MITSLLKVGLLSLASAIFPFRSTIAACSSSPLGQHAAIVKEEKIKKSNYNRDNNNITLYSSDVSSGFFDDFYYANNGTNSASGNYIYSVNNHEYTVSYSLVSIQNNKNIALINSGNLGFIVDFVNKTIYNYENGNTVYVDYVILPSTLSGTVFNTLKDYIYDNTAITISQSYLNTVIFTSTAQYLNSLNVNLYPTAVYNDVNYPGSLLQGNKLAFGDSEFWLDLTQADSGYWFNDGSFSAFTDNIVLYVGDSSVYNTLLNTVETDINANTINYKDKFIISYGFNYNAPYNVGTNDTLIQDSYFTSDTANTYHKYFYYDMPYFNSNGEIFNQVALEYVNAYGTRYKIENQSGNIIQYPSGAGAGYGYFQHLWFVNTDSGFQRLVYVRKFSQYLDNNNDLQTYLDRGGSWINTDYQYLNFYFDLSTIQKNNLAQLNNMSTLNGISNGGSVDLTSVFSLISSTLVSFTNFFNIGILPGISLGILVLIPFAITLLLVIIGLFKR